MPDSSYSDVPRPAEVKRLPWMRRIHVHSPKLSRTLVLFSYESLKAWALIESCPLITDFCEHPGYVHIDGSRVLADFWVTGHGRPEFLKLDGGVELGAEFPDRAFTYTNDVISRIPPDWFEPYQLWIANWYQINPYLVGNSRFVTPAMLARAADVFTKPRPLFDAEHALRDIDLPLARTAVFMLLHQGKLTSDDLMVRPLDTTTIFRRSVA